MYKISGQLDGDICVCVFVMTQDSDMIVKKGIYFLTYSNTKWSK